MPELPEVESVLRSLRDARPSLVGRIQTFLHLFFIVFLLTESLIPAQNRETGRTSLAKTVFGIALANVLQYVFLSYPGK